MRPNTNTAAISKGLWVAGWNGGWSLASVVAIVVELLGCESWERGVPVRWLQNLGLANSIYLLEQ